MPLHSPTLAGRPFHVLSLEGPTGAGKTHLVAEKAPGKVALFSTDNRWDGVVQKFEGWQDRFLVENYFINIDFTADELFREGARDAAEAAAAKQADRINKETWEPFMKDYRAALAHEPVRTLVLDQADEFNEYLRLANFGKLEKNPQMAYGAVNAEYKQLARLAHAARKNLVLIHQTGKKYKTIQDERGRDKSVEDLDALGRVQYKRRGNEHINYLVHSHLRSHRQDAVRNAKGEIVTPLTFKIEILNAKLNPAVNGEMLPAVIDWPTLMSYLAPDVPGEAWL